MKWPWKRLADSKAQTAVAQAQSEQAKREYEQTVRHRFTVMQALDALFYQADQNQIIENMQKVVRGR